MLDDEFKRAMTAAEIAWLGRIVGELESGRLVWSKASIRELAKRMEGA